MIRKTRSVNGDLQGEEVRSGSEAIRRVTQDVNPYLENAKAARDHQEMHGKSKHHMRLYASIPTVVAIAIKETHDLDILAPDFMRDPAKRKKFRYIMETEYKDLIVNT